MHYTGHWTGWSDDMPSGTAALFETSGATDVFASRHWCDLLARLLTNGAQASLLLATQQDGTAAGLLPILHTPKTHSVAALANYYTMRVPLLIAPGHDAAAVLPALFAPLRERRVQRLNLSPLPADPSLCQQIAAALQQHGFSATTSPVSENWYLDCTNLTYASFLEQRPTRLRQTIERRERKLKRSGNMDIRIVSGGTQALTLLDDFQNVYSRSWKPEEAFSSFIPEFAGLMAARQGLVLGVLYLSGTPIAAQFWLQQQGYYTIYKLAHDSACDALSPGTVLTAHMFAHALGREKTVEIDFGLGRDTYKRDWMSNRRQICQIQGFARGTPAVWAPLLRAKVRKLIYT